MTYAMLAIEETIMWRSACAQQSSDLIAGIEVVPQTEFLTYGVGIPLMQMRFPEKPRGRVAVAPA